MSEQPAPKPAPQPAPFPQIAGYRIEALIGRGSAGVVYRATQLAVERKVALKVLHAEVAARGRSVRRLQREARTTAKLAHPGIVTAIDMGNANGLWWYAMELVDGPSLAERLKKQGAMSEREALRVFIPLCEALEHAFEQGVVHRDIKPSNILIDGTGRARIVDLGLAFTEDDPMLTQQGGTLGTPHYISPEQARNPQAADVRSDIWSLGATLFHCVCGRPPFAGDSAAEILSGVLYSRIPDPGSINPELSKSLRLVLRKCLARDPSRRYQHPGELRVDLELIRERRQVHVKRGALDPVAGAMSAKQRSMWIGGIAVACAVVALFVFQPWKPPASDSARTAVEEKYPPLEEIVAKTRGNRAALAGAIDQLDAMRLEIPPQFEPRFKQLYADLNGEYNRQAQELARRFGLDLTRLAVDQRDFAGALRLIDDEIEARAKAELNPNPQRLAELLSKTLQLERKRADVVTSMKAALATLETWAKDHYNQVNVVRAQALREKGDWRGARAALSITAAELVKDSPAITAGLPRVELDSSLRHVQTLLLDEKVAELDTAWRKFDMDLAAALETRSGELAEALDARTINNGCDALRETYARLLADAHVTRATMLAEVSDTAATSLERLCAALVDRETANNELDARELFDEKREALTPLWAKRNYEEIAAQWTEAKSLAYLAPVAAAIDVELSEARLLQGVLVAAAQSISELARTGEKIELQIGTIRRSGTLEAGSDPLHFGFRLIPSEARAAPLLLGLRENAGERMVGRDELEKRAKLDGSDATQRLTLALLRWREGDVKAARELLPLSSTSVPDELRPLVGEATRRIEGSASAESRAEGQRLDEAKRLVQLINRVGRGAAQSGESEAQVRRIDELLSKYDDLPWVKDVSAEMRALKADLERPPAPISKKDFETLFKPTSVQLDGNRFTMRFDFNASFESAWTRGDWIASGQGWQARGTNSREDLAHEDLWPTLALVSPIAIGSDLELEVAFEQPKEAGLPRLFTITCAGVHVAFARPREQGREGRYSIASGGPEEFGRMVDEVLAGRGIGLPAFERGEHHKIRIELTQSRGAVDVFLDGKKLDSAQVRRPDPRAAQGTASVVLRSLDPVRVLEATLTGRIAR